MLKELIIPCTLVAVLGSMLLPVPPHVLDFLLVANLLLALLLLVSSLYISDSLKLSALPTILLLATLYRLALNVASTRLILGSGEAGQAIEAFGTIVIGSNLVVGVVVFLVITLIQFIVIAKGSERVAEVAARFTLDALPGKQMSIDADVRAGLIDFETARRRRSDLQTESRFYGALDGAMKFVKGDAIVGLLIVAVNIVGGLAVGILMEGLEVGQAVSKYTILTVGDGLLAQIPALLNALAAGMVVTRVTREDGATLAQELVAQVGQVKKAKVIIAGVSLLLAFVPGMPSLPFACLAGVLGLGALVKPAGAGKSKKDTDVKFEPKTPAVLQLRLDEKTAAGLNTRGGLMTGIQNFRKEVYEELGLVLLPPDLHFSAEFQGRFQILMRGVPVCTRQILDTEPGLVTKRILDELKQVVCQRTAEFIDDILTRRTLDYFDREAPELVSAVVPGTVSVTQLTEVLKGLAREGVTIRNFDLILQAIAETGARASNERILLEEVRVALGRVIAEKYVSAEGDITACLLDPALDLNFAQAERENRPLDTSLVGIVAGYLEALPSQSRLLIVSKAARRLIRECLKIRNVTVPVLAHDELPAEVDLKVCGKIELSDRSAETLLERLAA